MTKTSGVNKWRVMMCVAVAVVNLLNAAAAEPQVPCLFIFGDSLIDNGNNNDKPFTIAKGNFLPYGIDFPDGPTGRLTNGKTAADVISQLLGFDDYIPSYASARRRQILRGVNYASAAAGIRPETGRQLGDRTDFAGQVNNFKNTVAQLADILGDQRTATNYLSKCIYLTGLGNNDFINNYYLPNFYPTSLQYSLQQYTTLLIQQYSDQLRILYTYGARKFALIGLAPTGCTPAALSTYSPDGSTCAETINRSSQLFNKKLIELVDDFNSNLRDAQFVYLNGYDFVLDVINNGSAYGFKVTNAACCGLGRNNGTFICLPLQTPCANRNEYVFWDAYHPTEAANVVFGRRSYRAQNPSDAYPLDISRLAPL